MKLLALDPSSTLTGYAVMEDEVTVTDCGYLRPPRADAHSIDRTASICDDLEALVFDEQPDHIIVEVPSGHVRVKRFGAQGLTLYGFAAGAQFQVLRRYVQVSNERGQRKATIWRVDEQKWTKGATKAKRAKVVFYDFPKLRAALEADGGGDLADAIGLGRYWWLQVWKKEANRR